VKHRAPKIHNGEHMFRMVKDLKVVLGKGKGGGSKKTKKARKNAEKNAENNGNETSGLFKKKINILEPTILEGLDGASCNSCHACGEDCVRSTFLDITGKTKDTLNERMDIEEMKLRKDLEHETHENG
jgi:hypothetical protein